MQNLRPCPSFPESGSAWEQPRWDRGSRTEQRHPGHQETALREDKGQSWVDGWTPQPCPLPGAPSPGGVGKLMPFTMNRSMSLLLRSGKILPGGRVGDRHSVPLPCPPSRPFPQSLEGVSGPRLEF